jgi:predicted dienelactone hydrolase
MLRPLVLALLLAACVSSPPPASPAPAPAPDQPAPGHSVGVASFTVSRGPDRPLPATIWYPAQPTGAPAVRYYDRIPGIARENAPAAAGRFPVVLVSHGSGGERETQAYLAERLAAAGFAVAAVSHLGDTFGTYDASRRAEMARERPRDIGALLDTLAAQPPAPVAGALDLEHVAVYGHSFGGYTALALAGAAVAPTDVWRDRCATVATSFDCTTLSAESPPARYRDPRVDAVIAAGTAGWFLFGPEGTAAVETPVLLLAGGKDAAVDTPTFVQPLHDHLPTAHWTVELALGTHWTYIDICPLADQLPPPLAAQVRPECAPDAPLPVADAHRVLADVVIAFADHTLRGRSAADAGLTADAIRDRAGAVTVRVQTAVPAR